MTPDSKKASTEYRESSLHDYLDKILGMIEENETHENRCVGAYGNEKHKTRSDNARSRVPT